MGGSGESVSYKRFRALKTDPDGGAAERNKIKLKVNAILDNSTQTLTVIVLEEVPGGSSGQSGGG